MRYFIFRIEWSQTDSEMCVVYANSRVEAENRIRRNVGNVRYINYYGETDSIVK